MKKITLIVSVFLFIGNLSAQGITADEIIDNYLENTGGKDNWRALKGLRMTAQVNQGGMEIPVEVVQLADGRTYTKYSYQGTDLYLNVFDGENLWGINFQTMKAEKSDDESTYNFKLNLNDFPDSFLDYKDKGYSVELMGTETIDGTMTYKIKLVKEPIRVNGKEIEDVTFFYFHMEDFVPIVQDSEVKQGPQAGTIGRTTQSDYDEVGGLYFPFTLSQGMKDGPLFPFKIKSIEVNPEVDESVFKYPGG